MRWNRCQNRVGTSWRRSTASTFRLVGRQNLPPPHLPPLSSTFSGHLTSLTISHLLFWWRWWRQLGCFFLIKKIGGSIRSTMAVGGWLNRPNCLHLPPFRFPLLQPRAVEPVNCDAATGLKKMRASTASTNSVLSCDCVSSCDLPKQKSRTKRCGLFRMILKSHSLSHLYFDLRSLVSIGFGNPTGVFGERDVVPRGMESLAEFELPGPGGVPV